MLPAPVFEALRSQLWELERAAAAARSRGLWIPLLAALPALLASIHFVGQFAIWSGVTLVFALPASVVMARQLGWVYACVRDMLAQALRLPVPRKQGDVLWNGALFTLAFFWSASGFLALSGWSLLVLGSTMGSIGYLVGIASLPAAVLLPLSLDTVLRRGMGCLFTLKYHLRGLTHLTAKRDVALLQAAGRRSSRWAALAVPGVLLATCLLAGPLLPFLSSGSNAVVTRSLIGAAGLVVATGIAALGFFVHASCGQLRALLAVLADLEGPSEAEMIYRAPFAPEFVLASVRILRALSWLGVSCTAVMSFMGCIDPEALAVWLLLPGLWAVAVTLLLYGNAAVSFALGLTGAYAALHAELVVLEQAEARGPEADGSCPPAGPAAGS